MVEAPERGGEDQEQRDRHTGVNSKRLLPPTGAELVAQSDLAARRWRDPLADVHPGAVAHPPSGVRSPRRPSGRKTRIRIRIEKTSDCVQSEPGRVPVEPLVEGLDQPDQDRAEDGARQVADAAQHGGRERDQPELEALVVAHGRHVERVEHPGRARERARDHERERDRPVDVDAHHRARVHVLRGRAHRLPLPRLLHEVEQHQQDRRRHEDDDHLVPGVVDAADREDVRAREDVGRGDVVRAFPDQGDVLDHEAHADRGDQRCQARLAAQRTVGDELDRRVDRAAGRHHQHERQEDDRDRRGALALVQAEEARREGDREHAAEHEDVAVGEVDQLEDAVDERVPEGDEGVDAAGRDADQEDLEEVGRRLPQIDREPAEQHDHQQGAEGGDHARCAQTGSEPGGGRVGSHSRCDSTASGGKVLWEHARASNGCRTR